jgi:streptogramin lyase
MGPTLWSSDPDIFALANDEAMEYLGSLWGVPAYQANLGSHLDMLHETPLCMGMAWESENLYWVFNGKNGSIERVDFQDDHGPGFDDHDDGVIGRYVEGYVERVPDVPSHLVLDNSTGFLYIADTGNNAIKVLDTTSGVCGSDLSSMEWRVDHYQVDDADMWTLIDGSAAGLEQPSGLALVEDTLLVTDHATGFIYAFDLDGELIDWLDTERGADAVMGIEARSLDDIWFVDAAADKVFRLQPAE